MRRSNAIILAAGTASRFVPLSFEYPKGLLEVRGEILLERQIRQIKEAGIDDITVVSGYKANLFDYLKSKYGVSLVYNEDYSRYNNSSSIYRVLDLLGNSFICCSDHYYTKNVFLDIDDNSYYAVQYSEGPTSEWCVMTDDTGRIIKVDIGGQDAWYLSGHAFFNEEFSDKFRLILEMEYSDERVKLGYWEDVFVSHIEELDMRAKRYSQKDIYEFDSLDELRRFDPSYLENTRSTIIKNITSLLGCKESDLDSFVKNDSERGDFYFNYKNERFLYERSSAKVSKRDIS